MQTALHGDGSHVPRRDKWKTLGAAAVVICLVLIGVLGLVALVRSADFAITFIGERDFRLGRNSQAQASTASETETQFSQNETEPNAPDRLDLAAATPAEEQAADGGLDAGVLDAGGVDAGGLDAGLRDGGASTATSGVGAPGALGSPLQADVPDGGLDDGGVLADAAIVDAGVGEGGVDSGAPDASPAEQQAALFEQAVQARWLLVSESQLCGPNTCNLGDVCCNPSCGICTRPGGTCDQRQCMAQVTYPSSQMCGMATCNVGMVCCNPSCGICAPPGEDCSNAVCE